MLLFLGVGAFVNLSRTHILPGLNVGHALQCPTGGASNGCVMISIDAHSASPGSATNCALVGIGSQKPVCDTTIDAMTDNITTFRVGVVVNASTASPVVDVFYWNVSITYDPTFVQPAGDPSSLCTGHPDCGESPFWLGSQTGPGTINWASSFANGDAVLEVKITQTSRTQATVTTLFYFRPPCCSPAKTLTARTILESVAFELVNKTYPSTTSIGIDPLQTGIVDGHGEDTGVIAAPSNVCKPGNSANSACGQIQAMIRNVPPQASFEGSHTGTSYTFASTSYDTDGTIANPSGYFWDFGDGTTDLGLTGPTVIHDYGRLGAGTSPGKFTATLRVVDDLGATGAARDLQGAPIVNKQPSHAVLGPFLAELGPTASFTFSPSAPSVGQTVTFDASKTSYPENETVVYGSTPPGGTTALFDLQLQADDFAGNRNGHWDLTEPVVYDVDFDNTYSAPDVVISGNPTLGDPLTLDSKLVFIDMDSSGLWNAGECIFYDSNTDFVYDGIVSYSWNFGDGTIATGSALTIVTHTFAEANIVTVTLNVTDNVGGQAIVPTTISVYGASVRASPTPPSSFTQATITLNIDSTTSEGTSITQTLIDWGDGTIHTFAGAVYVDAHAYTSVGNSLSQNYTITVTVTNSVGFTARSTSTVTISDRPPTAAFTYTPNSPSVGQLINFDASSSTDPDGLIMNYAWGFGDTTTGSGPTPPHVYAASGTYTVTLVVTDNSFQTMSTSTAVQVVKSCCFHASLDHFKADVAINRESLSRDPTNTFRAFGANDGNVSVFVYVKFHIILGYGVSRDSYTQVVELSPSQTINGKKDSRFSATIAPDQLGIWTVTATIYYSVVNGQIGSSSYSPDYSSQKTYSFTVLP